jgi:hypothetical protein
MSAKRIINWEDYSMVVDWSGYQHTKTELPCKCEICGEIFYRSIKKLDNTGDSYCFKCSYEKRKKTFIKNYGVDNPSKSQKIKDKISDIYNKKSDDEKKDIKIKRANTNIELFGVENTAQINREDWQIEITSSKEKLEEYIKSFDVKPTTSEIRIKLGYSTNTYRINELLTEWDLYNYIDCSSSFSEKNLSEYITSLGFNVQKKRLKGCGEIDIFIPERNIGFEFNGSYWHSDLIVDKSYHYNKTTCCENEGIRLIHIFEYEWINNQDKIKSYIKAQLGLCEKRIFARKCYVKEIDFKTAKPLLEYHQQKATTANHYIGLYHQDELVLVMLFGRCIKGIFTKNPIAEWEIKREICKEGYSIVGGKSKVFSYFVKKYNPQSVVSYVDRAKFTGKSYQIMGFKLDHINGARYDWVYSNNKVFKKRQPRIYNEMKQLYDEGKVFRIYDAGRFCYLWKKK